MAGIRAMSGAAILGALLLLPAAGALAFDPRQRLQSEAGDAETDAPDDGDPRPDNHDATEEAPSAAEEAAVDLCAIAAEREATIDGRRGRVNAVGGVRQTGGGWEVEGVVETGRGIVGLFRDETLFNCFARNGRVESMRLDDGSDAG